MKAVPHRRYAVLGAASMAAGTTRTISSAILIFELTGGLQHILPILVAVVVSYIFGQWYSLSIFDSLLQASCHTLRTEPLYAQSHDSLGHRAPQLKGLVTMPEFKDVRTLQRTAEEMMRVRSTKAASQAPPTCRRPRAAHAPSPRPHRRR